MWVHGAVGQSGEHGAEGGETTLLKREGGSASGEREKWYIRAGNHVTLAELFNYGCQLCSCHFLYTLYLRQPIFVARKRHSGLI